MHLFSSLVEQTPKSLHWKPAIAYECVPRLRLYKVHIGAMAGAKFSDAGCWIPGQKRRC